MLKSIVGLTGAFGSGCTTAATTLRDERAFEIVRLSESIKVQWERENPGIEPTRADLQRLGDRMREQRGTGVVAEVGLSALRTDAEYVVVDGIRNLGEIAWLRNAYGYRFTLIAVLASHSDRWARIGAVNYTNKGRGQADFIQDDYRDANEDTEYGQQVQRCIDQADILLRNSEPVTLPKFRAKVLDYVDLVTGRKVRPARQREILMNLAFGASHSSKCLKRHVGAIVLDSGNRVVGVGYNENPMGTKACVEERLYEGRCYRDKVRNEHFAMLSSRRMRCPQCGGPLVVAPGPPWRCSACVARGDKINLEELFFPDRAMNWCTAVHAEVWAILAAGERARGGQLFTTTFPCFQCAEKITQTGIRRLFYTDPYPDVKAKHRLDIGGIRHVQFEGVRSASFERIFSSVRPG